MKVGQPVGKYKFRNIKDLAGKQFGRLMAFWCVGTYTSKKLAWSCQCECGNVRVVLGQDLRRGYTKSCGCLQPEMVYKTFFKDGRVKTREYAAFQSAKTRCTNRNNLENWELYGGRGIQFKFQSFEEFLSCVGPRPSGKHSLDRIDPDGHYEPGNVRWATSLEQNKNQRRNRALDENAILRKRIEFLESEIAGNQFQGATYADAIS